MGGAKRNPSIGFFGDDGFRRAQPILLTERDLLNRINVIWPVQPPLQEYFPSSLTQISSLNRTVPSHRGALRNVINAGRDAVDAGSMLDESC
jgi:hypothetical protein